ncbi:MAG TPA: alpha-glucosidase/alpha-galactosidase, partial [Phycisphaerae bacterium]|nr:alpha-glucosidase/alpha-galactosidase [Phycisphaerae bacterium]
AQLAALNQSNVSVQTLTVEAALTGDVELAMQAIALDPLAAACCTLAEIREMTAEMLAAEAKWLPDLAGKQLRPTPAISVPKDVEPVSVPTDPALAVASRFGSLLAQKSD